MRNFIYYAPSGKVVLSRSTASEPEVISGLSVAETDTLITDTSAVLFKDGYLIANPDYTEVQPETMPTGTVSY